METHPKLEREDLKKALKGHFVKGFDHENIKELRHEIDSKLSILEMTYGIKASLGRIRFSNWTFTATLNCSVLNTPEGLSAEQSNWNIYCSSKGFKTTDFGRKIRFPSTLQKKKKKWAGQVATICGINLRAKMFPIIVKLNDGSTVKCSAEYVKQRMI